ncbi:ABC transporter permease [Frigoribacterium sp. CFBP 8751]|nr:ABC transporter permease [Frigoribacterium sp. CFBP 8751]
MADAKNVASERLRRLEKTDWQDAGATGTFLSGFTSSVRDIWAHRELLGMLTKRELKARYKDSTLGFLWSLARPLTQLFIYYVVLGQFLGAARNIPNFAIYIFAGLTVYTVFSEIVGAGTASIVANAGLVKKVYLPREVFTLSSVGSSLFNFAIQFVILLIAALVTQSLRFGPHLLYGLAGLVLVLVYAVALGLLLGALNVFLRDIQYLVEVILMLVMWGSPIVYSWTQVQNHLPGWLVQVYLNNPVTLAVIGFQEAFWSAGTPGTAPDNLFTRMVVAGLVGLVLLFISQRVFSRLQGNFAQEL